MSNFLSILLGRNDAATTTPAAAQAPRVVGRPTTDAQEAQIEAWLAEKAKKYPKGTPAEKAAEWQDSDRQRYRAHFAQLAAAPTIEAPKEGTLRAMLRGGDW